jgi:beta-phosphoglucomutase
MFRALIFDFDGVIVDSELIHYQALNQAFGRYNVFVPKEEHWAKYLGYSDIENIEAVSKDYKMGLTPSQVEKLAREKMDLFEEMVRKQTTVIDGVADFIAMLVENGLHIGICSGALLSDIKLMLEYCDFAGVFETIVAADHVKAGKPDPQGYILALSHLNNDSEQNILPSQCIVVEDSQWGLTAAIKAGMHTIGVTNSYPREKIAGLAEKVVDKLSELTINDLQKLCDE